MADDCDSPPSTAGSLAPGSEASGVFGSYDSDGFGIWASSYTILLAETQDDAGSSMATAASLEVGEIRGGTLEVGRDRDWYGVQLQAGVTYFIKAQGSEGEQGETAYSSYHGRLRLFDSAGGQLESAIANIMPNNSYTMPFTPATSGTYYIEMADEEGKQAGHYSISASVGVKDDRIIARYLPIGTVQGQLEHPDDSDGFLLRLQKGDTYSLVLAPGPNEDNSLLKMLYTGNSFADGHSMYSRPDGTIRVIASSQTTKDLSISVYTSPPEGTPDYTIKVAYTQAATQISGTSGNDILGASANNARIEGGAGLDTASYAGSRASYFVTFQSLKGIVEKTGSTDMPDILSNVERLLFQDGAVALDIDGHAGQAYRLYQAALNRAPDLVGLGFWISHLDNGSALVSIAQGFLDSPEAQQLYGAAQSDADFVTSLYNNVLQRAPEAAGMTFWLNHLQNGMSHAQMLTSFSESAENQANALKLIGSGIEYTPYG